MHRSLKADKGPGPSALVARIHDRAAFDGEASLTDALGGAIAKLHAVPVRETVSFHGVRAQFRGDGEPSNPEAVNNAATALLNQLSWWADALSSAKTRRDYPSRRGEGQIERVASPVSWSWPTPAARSGRSHGLRCVAERRESFRRWSRRREGRDFGPASSSGGRAVRERRFRGGAGRVATMTATTNANKIRPSSISDIETPSFSDVAL